MGMREMPDRSRKDGSAAATHSRSGAGEGGVETGQRARLLLITGEIGAGKTTFCWELADRLRERAGSGLDVAGIVSPGVWDRERKIGIDAVTLRSGERRRLAIGRTEASAGPGTQSWVFQPETVIWANRVLAQAVSCDVLIVDELGPLEWLRGEGFVAGIEAVSSGRYRYALVVVRAALLDHARRHWPQAEEVQVDSMPGARALARRWARQLELR